MNTEELDNLGSGEVSAEILWRGNKSIGTEDWDMGIKQEKIISHLHFMVADVSILPKLSRCFPYGQWLSYR